MQNNESESLGAEFEDIKRRILEIGERIGNLTYPFVVMGDDYYLELADKITNRGAKDSDRLVFCHSDILFVIEGVVLSDSAKASISEMRGKLLDDLGLVPEEKSAVNMSQELEGFMSSFRSLYRQRLYAEDGMRARVACEIKWAFGARVELLELERDLLIQSVEEVGVHFLDIESELNDRRKFICANYANMGRGVNPGFELKTITLRGKPVDKIYEDGFEESVLSALITSGLASQSACADFEETDDMHELLLILTAMEIENEKGAKKA